MTKKNCTSLAQTMANCYQVIFNAINIIDLQILQFIFQCSTVWNFFWHILKWVYLWNINSVCPLFVILKYVSASIKTCSVSYIILLITYVYRNHRIRTLNHEVSILCLLSVQWQYFNLMFNFQCKICLLFHSEERVKNTSIELQ